MKNPYKPSEFWDLINKKQLSEENTKNLENFKSSETNFKLAYWNPNNNGLRYFKDLLYNLSTDLNSSQLSKIAKVKNSGIGNPIFVTIDNVKISMDCLMALYEVEFIGKYFDFNKAKIMEIGAGYGRTAHFILSNYNIQEYYIVDLENSIHLSRQYLSEALDKHNFSKIKFISVDEFAHSDDVATFDICMNMNSFAEMDESTVLNYLSYIDKNAKHFYTRNPVGKYLDKTLDNHFQGIAVVKKALQLGILRDVIDIYDSSSIKKQAKKFLTAYRPGKSWTALGSSWAKPWSFYWQAIYKNKI